MRLRTTTILTGLALWAGAAAAQSDWRPSYTTYGTPGLIEMPSGLSEPDAQFSLTVGGFDLQQRYTMSFQISDRLGGTFRYSRIDQFGGPGEKATYDRSFDIRYRFVDEGRYLPAMTVGLRDFLGTGRYSGEYIAATKTFGDRLRVTAGLGWGRLGSEGGFTNPLGVIDEGFETRPNQDDESFYGEGGTVGDAAFFRGDAAVFGGVEYRFNDRFTGVVEYSTDAYTRQAGRGTYDHESPLNFGVTYTPRPEYAVQLAYLNGSTLSLAATFSVNPFERPTFGGMDPAPVPVAVRPADTRAALSWNRSALPEGTLRDLIAQTLASDGQEVTGVELTDRSIRIRYENTKYRTEAQAMGRINRILTNALPASIEVITLEPVRAGVPVASVTFRRSDIEQLENVAGGTAASLDRAVFADPAGTNAGIVAVDNGEPRFQWGIAPYFAPRLFDPDYPFYASIGIEASADYYVRPNLVLSGAVRYRVFGDRDPDDRVNDGALPPVRTQANSYHEEGNPSIERLTLTHFGRPAQNLYSRVSIGYLEEMFGGISTELLWRPVGSRLALGVEANYVMQRDFDLMLGFRDYDVVTGHASAYYDLGNGYHAQVDAGRYLAGDWGATFALDREFDNGWRVGAYFTRTNVSFEDYGQGSFAKGLRVTIPTDWSIGTPNRQAFDTQFASLRRNGGARLELDNRLYETLRDAQSPMIEDSWGRYWR
ncbi:YjbH domain-containing protein [Roseisalinus antarcticus]|uniref:YjbH domain-containing protein n=1 Tax=Roseisalinus antarcticus TaxID=254357 RepID=A0A1Y5SM06_9RHOB|nr:YjbH domain-containing protein [Roseisalinus antarcticus]SLN42692.1 hypothetical protein ROA7023_01719 [Roseisalinus antarcticus]